MPSVGIFGELDSVRYECCSFVDGVSSSRGTDSPRSKCAEFCSVCKHGCFSLRFGYDFIVFAMAVYLLIWFFCEPLGESCFIAKALFDVNLFPDSFEEGCFCPMFFCDADIWKLANGESWPRF